MNYTEAPLLEVFCDGVPRGKALDIGTALGGNLRILNDIGFQGYGVDCDYNSVREAQYRDLDVTCAIFPDEMPERLSSTTYSLITMLEVVYYLPDMREALDWVRRHLVSHGYLLIQFHNAHSAYYNHPLSQDRYGGNLKWRPSLPVIDFWLDSCGFDVLQTRGWFRTQQIPILRGEKMTMKNTDRIMVTARKR